MNFFKSVFQSDPDPPNPLSSSPKASPSSPANQSSDPSHPNADAGVGSSAWSFGGLVKSIATKSESVIEIYRRDLDEFGAGLKKETAVLADAIKDLPAPIESLEYVGHAIDGLGSSVWKGTVEVIAQGKDAFLADEGDGYSSDAQRAGSNTAGRFSRFEVQVCAIQSDPSTYCEDPEDLGEFGLWRKEVSLEEKAAEIESLAGAGGAMEAVYGKLVPNVVDHETFWWRYFYKIHKLKQAEDARASLVKRAIAGDEEEELSWEIDDDEEAEVVKENKPLEAIQRDAASEINKEDSSKVVEVGFSSQPLVDNSLDGNDRTDNALNGNGRSDNLQLIEDGELSVVAAQPAAQEEDDIGWDEIEDIGSGDEKVVCSSSGSSSKEDARKRLSVAEEDEDLTWDIEDDDPPKH